MSERRHITWDKLKHMLPQQCDKLPMPAEFRAWVGKGKKRKEVRVRKEWVGFAWIDLGTADGTEPLLVTEE